jgi:hypothetical protein
MTHPLLTRWLTSKGLTWHALAAVTAVSRHHKILFPYTELDDHRYYNRVYDLRRWEAGLPYKLWVTGARAKGALWWPRGESHKRRTKLLVCEGETDTLAAIQHDCPWDVVCVPGTSMLDTTFPQRVGASTYDTVLLAFDSDEPGNRAALQAARLLAQEAPSTEVLRVHLPHDAKDLRDALQSQEECSWDSLLKHATSLHLYQERRTTAPFSRPAPWISAPGDWQPKPDLQTVWNRLCPPTRPLRHDGHGRPIRQAWCPLHDDGREPAAWVGHHRWGCFACGIDSADVYELVAWVKGIVPPGVKLSGHAFREAQKAAQELA